MRGFYNPETDHLVVTVQVYRPTTEEKSKKLLCREITEMATGVAYLSRTLAGDDPERERAIELLTVLLKENETSPFPVNT